MKEFDVAIVGAGPAGSSTALSLARSGIHVVLLDRARFPRDKLCGDFLNPINWRVLDELGVSEEILARPHVKISTFRMTAATRAEAVSLLPGQGERPFGLGLRRFHLDHVLLERARQLGVSVVEGSKVAGLEQGARSWRLDIEDGGDRRALRARCLVGADGRNSRIAEQLGVTSRPNPRSRAVGFEIQLTNVAALGASIEIHQFAGGYAGLVRVDDDTVNLGFTVRQSGLGRAVSFARLRQHWFRGNEFLDAALRDAEPVSALRSVSPVYFPRRRCFGAGFVLVGDAARVTEPVTGEGIFLALRSGQLAARTIATALRAGDLSAPRLSPYDRDCRSEFGPRLRLNSLIRLLIYRPQLFTVALRLLGSRQRLLAAVLNAICLPRAAFES